MSARASTQVRQRASIHARQRAAAHARPRATRATRGETLAETLAAILVSGLALLILAMSVISAFTSGQLSRTAMEGYFADDRRLAAPAAQPEGAEGVGTGTVTLTDVADDGSTSAWFSSDVRYYDNRLSGDRQVVAYEAPIE